MLDQDLTFQDAVQAYGASSATTRRFIDRQLRQVNLREGARTFFPYLGMLVGAGVVITFLFVAADLVRNGHPIAGTVFAGVDIASLAAVFVFGRHPRGAAITNEQ